MGDDRSTRIAVVDDHGLISHTLATALVAHGFEVQVVDPNRTDDLTREVVAHAPDLVLLDLDLGAHGSALRHIQPLTERGTAVVVVTGVTDAVRHAQCIAAGALGVLSKGTSFDHLVDAVTRAAEVGALLSEHEREEHLAVVRTHTASERNRLADFDQLTARETQVLAALMRGSSVEAIAADEFIGVATVRTHVRGVLTKLGVSSQLAAVARAVGAGWRPPDGA